MTDFHHSLHCDCGNQPSVRQVNGPIAMLFPGCVQVDAHGWKALLKCRSCGQLWTVDEWDKYQLQLVVKIAHAADWKTSDEAQRKAHLASSRGGTSESNCMWNDCGRKQLKGSAFCVDHLFATGARS
jgi:hypothetical protein